MFNATVGEALMLIVITDAFAVISVCPICCRQFRVALSVLPAPESGLEKIVAVVFGARVYPPVESSVDPFNTGFAPLPYAPNVIGDPLDPLDGTVSDVPYQISPRLNKIESPGENVAAFTFAIVCHGAPELVPLLESLPAAAT
jgi:hypothetical protein